MAAATAAASVVAGSGSDFPAERRGESTSLIGDLTDSKEGSKYICISSCIILIVYSLILYSSYIHFIFIFYVMFYVILFYTMLYRPLEGSKEIRGAPQRDHRRIRHLLEASDSMG